MVTFTASVNDCPYITYSNEMMGAGYGKSALPNAVTSNTSTGATCCSSQGAIESAMPLVWPLWQCIWLWSAELLHLVLTDFFIYYIEGIFAWFRVEISELSEMSNLILMWF